jgi:hypothetical protein
MNTFLLLISLLLNGVALFAIIILFVRQNRLAQVETNQAKNIQDMEDAISSYLLEMKEENDRFIERFKEVGRESGYRKVLSKGKSEVALIGGKEDLPPPPKNDNPTRLHVVNAYRQNFVPENTKQTHGNGDESIIALIDYHSNEIAPSTSNTEVKEAVIDLGQQEDLYQQSLLAQVALLQRQGFSEEEIAKILKKGKTEIELLIKFRQD